MSCLIYTALGPEFLCCDARHRLLPHVGLIDPSRPNNSPQLWSRIRMGYCFFDLISYRSTVLGKRSTIRRGGLVGPSIHRLSTERKPQPDSRLGYILR